MSGLFPSFNRNLYFLYGIVTIGFAIGRYSFAQEVGPWLGVFLWGNAMPDTSESWANCSDSFHNSTHSLPCWLVDLQARHFISWGWHGKRLLSGHTFGGFIKLTIYYLTGNAAGPWFESPMCSSTSTVDLDLTILPIRSATTWFGVRSWSVTGRQKEKTKSGKATRRDI